MISDILSRMARRGPVAAPQPVVADRMCGAYGTLMRELVAILPHDHTRIEVQHMLYVAQVLSIARNGRPIFQNQFVATSKGPLIAVLWHMQSSQEGMAQLMHPMHLELLDDDDQEVLRQTASKLGRLDDKQIAVYSNSSASAAGRIFVEWMSEKSTVFAKIQSSSHWSLSEQERNPTGTLGTRHITIADLEAEARRRYENNALERADREAEAKAARIQPQPTVQCAAASF